MDTKPVRVEVGLDGVPMPVQHVVATLEDAGFPAYLVGGGVRDLLLRRVPGDFDVATAAPAEALLAIFPRAIPIGLHHGTVMVPTAVGPVDVTTFRHGDDLAGDLAHRDFTINAIAWHPQRRELVDPHEGQDDLAKRRVRAVGAPAERLAEDPLRALRGIRLAAQLGFDLDPSLHAPMREVAPRLREIARERIRHELMLLLVSPGVATALETLAACGITPVVAGGARDDAAAVVARLPADPVLRLAGWLRDTRSTGILRDLRFPRRVNREVEHLLRCHPIEAGVDPERDGSVRRHLRRVGAAELVQLVALRRAEVDAGTLADPEQTAAQLDALEAAVARVEAAGRVALQRQDLAIDGNEVMRLLGRGPGRHVGDALAYLTERVLEEPAENTPERLRALLAEHAGESSAEESR